jgi:hypothetical protein
MATLKAQAKQFLSSKRRMNPPGDDREISFNEFMIHLKSQGKKMNSWSEGQWFQAAREFGFEEQDLADLMEQVASWGVDD